LLGLVWVARKAITAEIDPAISEAISLGFIPKFIDLLKNINDNEIRVEILWSLSNIAGNKDEYTNIIRETDIQYFIIELIKTCSLEVKEKSLWVLGNILANNIEMRDKLLTTSLLETLYQIFYSIEIPKQLIDSAIWVFSNLTQGKPSPPLDKFTRFFPLLKSLLKSESKSTVNDTLWTISYLTDRNVEAVNILADYIDFPLIIKSIASNNINDIIPALRIIGNVCTTDNGEIVRKIYQLNTLEILQQLLKDQTMENLHKEACWVLSNIAMGPSECLIQFFDCQLFSLLITYSLTYPNQCVLYFTT